MELTLILALVVAFALGAIAGFTGWHLYYMRALPNVVKKVGYAKRSKNKATRAPRKPKDDPNVPEADKEAAQSNELSPGRPDPFAISGQGSTLR